MRENCNSLNDKIIPLLLRKKQPVYIVIFPFLSTTSAVFFYFTSFVIAVNETAFGVVVNHQLS